MAFGRVKVEKLKFLKEGSGLTARSYLVAARRGLTWCIIVI